MTFTEQLQELGACEEAIEWVNGRSLRKCWQVSDRGDWMLWLAAKADIDRKLLVLAACDCAEPALKHVSKGEDRPRKAIETARVWAEGKATLEEVKAAAGAAAEAAEAAEAARTAARTAAGAAARTAAGAAARTMAGAAGAARTTAEAARTAGAAGAAWAAGAAAGAAGAAWAAGAAGAAWAAWAASLKHSAKLVRKRIPVELIEQGLGG